MSAQNTMDLTVGKPLKQLLLFSLPLVAGTLFQQLYSFADTVMVGRFIGEQALAAVGSTYSLHFLTLGFVQGACVGFGIPLALATVASQLVSGLLNLGWMVLKTDLLRGCSGLRGFSRRHAATLCRIGLPMGFEYSVSAIGAVILQGAINALGTAAIAGQTAGEKIRQMFTLPMESVGMGMATYVGQNEGARRYDRITQGIRAGLTIQWTYCAAAWGVIFFGKGAFTRLVLGDASAEATALSVQYLAIISCLFCIHGALMILRNTLQGMGYSIHAVLSGVGELTGRAICSWAAMRTASFVGICLANPAAWGLALLYCTVMVAHYLRRRLDKAAG